MKFSWLWLAIGCAWWAQGVEFISHAGESADAPANTMSAFRLAWERDADGVECDVHLTRDGEVVTCHNPNTRLHTGVAMEIADSTLAELRQLDFGSQKAPEFAGEKIPLLSELLATVPEHKKVYIEIKADNPELVKAIQQVTDASGLQDDQIVIISFLPAMIEQSTALMPEHAAFLVASWDEYRDGAEALGKRALECGASGLDLAYQLGAEAAFPAWREAGLRIGLWTVDDPAIARHYAAQGVEFITSNRAGMLKKELLLTPDESR